MKLLFCSECHDVTALAQKTKWCICGRSWGRYVGPINAVMGGCAIPLGFNNKSFVTALTKRPKNGLGEQFEAFVIPKYVDSITYEKTLGGEE